MGRDELLQELLAQVSELGTPKNGEEAIRSSALAKAERSAQEELKVLGWSAQELQGLRKGNPRKVRIAARVREWPPEGLRSNRAKRCAALTAADR